MIRFSHDRNGCPSQHNGILGHALNLSAPRAVFQSDWLMQSCPLIQTAGLDLKRHPMDHGRQLKAGYRLRSGNRFSKMTHVILNLHMLSLLYGMFLAPLFILSSRICTSASKHLISKEQYDDVFHSRQLLWGDRQNIHPYRHLPERIRTN